MTLFVKNLTNDQIIIKTINLALQVGEIRKLVADFDKDNIDLKAELDLLLDDKYIEIIDSVGYIITDSETFDTVSKLQILEKTNELQTEDLKEDRFYYVEDIFCIQKGEVVEKVFKGYVDTFKIIVKKKSVKFRIKSEGVTMPWQLLVEDKEIIMSYEYRMKNPSFEILSDKGDVSIEIYIDGYVNGLSANDLQNFIDTWYEDQEVCEQTSEWYEDRTWRDAHKISDGFERFNWMQKVGKIKNKKINVNAYTTTEVKQQNTGSKLIIPANKTSLVGSDTHEFMLFQKDDDTIVVEQVGYNSWSSWNLNHFYIEAENVREVEFLDQLIDLTNIELLDWEDRFTVANYYTTTGVKFIDSNAGYKSAIGIYTTDTNNQPSSAILIIDDQSKLEEGEPLSTLSSGEYDFFIVANGAGEISMDSNISFNTSGTFPTIIIDDVEKDLPVFFTDPLLNFDGKDHFIYKDDGNGGTNIYIEDMTGNGDKDFDDIVLNVNFQMTDKILNNKPSTVIDKFKLNGIDSIFAINTDKRFTRAYSIGKIEINEEKRNLILLNNAYDIDLQIKFQDYSTGITTYYVIPPKTQVFKTIPEKSTGIKMEYYYNGRKKYSRVKAIKSNFNNEYYNLNKFEERTITEISKTDYYS